MYLRILFSFVLTGAIAGCSGQSKKAESVASTKVEATTKGQANDGKALIKAQPSSTAAAETQKVTCEANGDNRLLEIRAKGKGCELAYTKGGTENIVASSQNGRDHCLATLEKIKGRLEAAGFGCK